MLLRRATPADIDTIYEITKTSLGYDYPKDLMKEQLLTIISSPHDLLTVATINQEVVGYVHGAYYLAFYSPALVNILALAVAIDQQGKGLGKALMTHIEAWAKERNAKGVRLNSGAEREAAHLFYESVGYTKVKYQANLRKLF